MSSKSQQAEVNLNKFNLNDLSKIDKKYCKRGQALKSNNGGVLEDDTSNENSLEQTNGKKPYQLPVDEIPSTPKKKDWIKIYRYPPIEVNKDFKDFGDREAFRASSRYKETTFP
jgi:hypothetical protein